MMAVPVGPAGSYYLVGTAFVEMVVLATVG